MPDFNKIFEFFEEVSNLFYLEVFPKPNPKFPDWEKNDYDFLGLFIGYAFARQGAAPDYYPVACDVIKEQKENRLSSYDAQGIWENYCKKLNYENLNPTRNPFCPQGNCEYYQLKNGKRKKVTVIVNKHSIIKVLGDFAKNQNLITSFKTELENNGPENAHKDIKKVNGISNKIASLILRDIAVKLKIPLKKDAERWRFQPIDTWLAFTIGLLNESRNKPYENYQKESVIREIFEFIIEYSSSPEKANAGIWYFCGKISESSQYTVNKYIKEIRAGNFDNAYKFTNNYIENKKNIFNSFPVLE